MIFFLNFKLIWFFLKRNLKWFVCILILTLAVACFESISLAALYHAINALFQISSSDTNADRLFLFLNFFIERMPFDDLLSASCFFLIIALFIRFLLCLGRETIIALAGGKVMYQIKKDLFSKYTRFSYDFFINEKQGNILYMMTNAPNRTTNALLGVAHMVSDFLRIAAITVVLAILNFQLTVAFIVLAFFYLILTNQIAKKRTYVTGMERLRSYTALTSITSEFCTGFKNIIACDARPFWRNRFDVENRMYSRYFVTNLIWLAIPRNVMLFIGTSTLFLLALYFRRYHSEQFLASMSTMGVFTMAIFQILPSLSSVGQKYMEVTEMQPDLEIIHKLLMRPTVNESTGSHAISSFHESIEFRNVTFNYEGREPTISNAHLTIRKKDVVAIVGASGVGKTTILNLIMGFYEPSKGDIFVDGHRLQDIQLGSWRQRIGFVSQDPFIYHATVLENIQMGRGQFTYDEIVNASKIANAHDFILNLPKSYETVIGERGMKLSGGQQQRIAIARALLGNPDIIILDEATSALDEESERLIQDALKKVSMEKTLFLVAHRLSTLGHANRIYAFLNNTFREFRSLAEYEAELLLPV